MGDLPHSLTSQNPKIVTDSKSEKTNEGNELLKTKLSNQNKRIAELEDRV